MPWRRRLGSTRAVSRSCVLGSSTDFCPVQILYRRQVWSPEKNTPPWYCQSTFSWIFIQVDFQRYVHEEECARYLSGCIRDTWLKYVNLGIWSSEVSKHYTSWQWPTKYFNLTTKTQLRGWNIPEMKARIQCKWNELAWHKVTALCRNRCPTVGVDGSYQFKLDTNAIVMSFTGPSRNCAPDN